MFYVRGFLILMFFAATFLHNSFANYHDAILLQDVKTLTLYKGRYTAHRRVPAVLQLQCIGGSAGCSVNIDVVQCENKGSDGIDIQWECKTDMSSKYRFGSIAVSCEGYNHPDDPYVLKGSCGLEYSLELTDPHYGAPKYHESRNYYGGSHKPWSSDISSGNMLGLVLVVGVIALLCWFFYNNQNPHRASATPPQPPTYGFDTQPPPYGFASQPPPYGFKDTPRQTGQGGFGGFWSGAGIGGLMGYLFGSRNNNCMGTGYSTHSPPRSSFWGGSRGWSNPSTSSGFSASSSSGTRTASGFGGTKRR